jgi:hypothetical protein
MFFDGFADKGRCPAGFGHEAAGFDFILSHDIPVAGLNQGGWRFCTKCHTMFFNGSSGKGRCQAGGGHTAAGFHFVLTFQGNLPDPVLVPADD